VKKYPVELNGRQAQVRVSLARGPPMSELCFGDGERYAQPNWPGLDGPEWFLQVADVPSVGEGGAC